MGVKFLPHAVGESIWGIDEDKVEATRRLVLGTRRQPAAGIGADQLDPIPKAESLDVAECSPRVAVDQRRVRGASRQRLDRQRPGPAVEIEDRRPFNPRPQRREDRLARPIRGRPHLPTPRRHQPLPPQLSSDDAHETNLRRD